jgi:hypothetical protein
MILASNKSLRRVDVLFLKIFFAGVEEPLLLPQVRLLGGIPNATVMREE